MEAQLEEKNQELQRVCDPAGTPAPSGAGDVVGAGGPWARLSSPSSAPSPLLPHVWARRPHLHLVCWEAHCHVDNCVSVGGRGTWCLHTWEAASHPGGPGPMARTWDAPQTCLRCWLEPLKLG